MEAIKATVRSGQLELDAPPDRPEGNEVLAPPDVYCLGAGRLEVPLVPWHTRHFITADPDFGNGPEGVGRNAVVPLKLTEKGKRANVQNEIVGWYAGSIRRLAERRTNY
jgi:hypothetical protein